MANKVPRMNGKNPICGALKLPIGNFLVST